MANILEQMQMESLKSDAVDSLDEARAQLKTLTRMEWIGIMAIAGIVTFSPFIGSWIIPFAPVFAPTSLRPPMTAAAKKLPANVRKHLMYAIWAQCEKDMILLFMVLAFCAWGIGLKGVGGGIVGIIFLFMLLRSFMKILAYRKTAKHIVIQQKTLVN